MVGSISQKLFGNSAGLRLFNVTNKHKSNDPKWKKVYEEGFTNLWGNRQKENKGWVMAIHN